MIYLKQYFGWPDQPSSGLDRLLTYKNEITIFYGGECRNTYFEIKRSGGNDEQNKQNKEKRGHSKVTSFTIHHVYWHTVRFQCSP